MPNLEHLDILKLKPALLLGDSPERFKRLRRSIMNKIRNAAREA